MKDKRRDLGELIGTYGKRRSKAKIYVFASILVVVATLVLWPLLGTKTGIKTDIRTPIVTQEVLEQRRVVHPQYLSTDSHERPYKLTADYGEQKDAQTFFLSNPEIRFILSAGNVVILRADTGLLDQEHATLKLRDNVVLRHQTGHALYTASADIDLRLGNAEGHDPVSGDGPMGALQAKGFRLYNGGEKIVFLGNGTLTIIPSQVSKKDKDGE